MPRLISRTCSGKKECFDTGLVDSRQEGNCPATYLPISRIFDVIKCIIVKMLREYGEVQNGTKRNVEGLRENS
jgi:hypothetical protein